MAGLQNEYSLLWRAPETSTAAARLEVAGDRYAPAHMAMVGREPRAL